MKKLLSLLTFLIIVISITVGLVYYARGYRPNFKDKKIQATGIVSVRSTPTDATLFVDGEKKGNTNLDIADLAPGKYTIRLSKEGFTTWEKKILVKKEAVNLIDVTLFPIAPTLRALTFNGFTHPVISPSLDKIIFAVTSPQEAAGIWALNLNTNQIPLFFSKGLTQLVKDTQDITYSLGKLQFSPNGKQLLIEMGQDQQFFLIDSSKQSEKPNEVTLDIEKLKLAWNNQRVSEKSKNLKNLSKEAVALVANLSSLSFSPDKTKVAGFTKAGLLFLYDSKPQPGDGVKTYTMVGIKKYVWFPDNRHLISIDDGLISIIDIDGTNKMPIYTGSFEPNFVVPWPDGSKIVILTNLNTAVNKLPNLYAIELR